MALPETMVQTAPFPKALASLIERLEYRPGWQFNLLVNLDRGQGSEGLTFRAIGQYPDTYNPERIIRIQHFFPVPPAAYNETSWRRWIFERLLEIERHEAAEFFKIDGSRPYAPHHGPGNDPYIIFEHGTELEARTTFTGDVAETGV